MRCIMRRRPESQREALLSAVATGTQPTTAAKQLGIPAATLRSWRRRDARFAEALARAAAGAMPAPLGPGEWKGLLAERCRAGNVGALRLWKDTYGVEIESDESAEVIALRSIRARVRSVE
jgi:hypothetical protein